MDAVGKSAHGNLTHDRQEPVNIQMLFQMGRKRIKRSIHCFVITSARLNTKARQECRAECVICEPAVQVAAHETATG